MAEKSEKVQNIQDVFLNKIRKDKHTVTVFLVNGVKLQGVVTWFDNFSLLLRRETHVQLVYKHAISTIMPTGPLTLYESGETNVEEGASSAE
ncbi:MAG: RNA chaperone Hfq [Micavibrio aeruginosavorus]|uniref:RNA-binding protein Hfq n=1 Tax=Micavibrio aeruginosavorus TaxID=349221 RepID=A0A2W5FEP3_9BACT|nr:MAG: RNA chaperone Hfq [Micavibrio aeruginosavorus]